MNRNEPVDSIIREQIDAEEAEVRDLLLQAGPREVIPARDLAVIRSAARKEWQEMVLAEEKRQSWFQGGRGLALAASLLVALLVGWLWSPWSRQAMPVVPVVVASIDVLEGELRLVGSQSDTPLEVGISLTEGALLETVPRGGAPSRAALRMSGGQSLRLDTGTRVHLTSSRRIELERGAVYFDSGPNAPTSGFEIGTSFGTVSDIGTQFEVRLLDQIDAAAALRVRVREGEVQLASGSAPHTVKAGVELTIQGVGSVETGTVEPYGPEWEWVVASAPRLQSDDVTLEEYLDWVCREMGFEYQYEDESVAQLKNEHGPGLADLAPDQSLRNASLAFVLGFQIEDGTLLVTGSPNS